MHFGKHLSATQLGPMSRIRSQSMVQCPTSLLDHLRANGIGGITSYDIPIFVPGFRWLNPLLQITAVVSGAITYGAVSLFRVSNDLCFIVPLASHCADVI